MSVLLNGIKINMDKKLVSYYEDEGEKKKRVLVFSMKNKGFVPVWRPSAEVVWVDHHGQEVKRVFVRTQGFLIPKHEAEYEMGRIFGIDPVAANRENFYVRQIFGSKAQGRERQNIILSPEIKGTGFISEWKDQEKEIRAAYEASFKFKARQMLRRAEKMCKSVPLKIPTIAHKGDFTLK